MKVVHVITSLTTGGAERQLELLINRSSHQSAVIALYEGGLVADGLRAGGHPVTVLGMRGWRKAITWLRLALLLRRYHPDVVHVHLLAAQLWAIPAARLAGVPVVVSTEHSLMDDTIEGRPHTRALQAAYRALEKLSTHTIAVSAATARRLQRWHVTAERITVVDNGIDFAALRYDERARAQVRAELDIGPHTRVIGVLARLEPVKRLDQVLRASAARLRAGDILVVAGTGTLHGVLQSLATDLGVESAVRWVGARSDVPQLLSAMDVLVSASRDETFGMGIVEALASGLAVVYAQCPALETLADPVAQALAIPLGCGVQEEVTLLSEAIGQALGRGGPDAATGRYLVPPELISRYGVEQAAARVDALYRRLSTAGAR